MCVTRWFWKLENGYKDEHSSIHQHRCPLCCCLQQHSPPVSGCSTKGKRCCCKFGHILAENKHLSIILKPMCSPELAGVPARCLGGHVGHCDAVLPWSADGAAERDSHRNPDLSWLLQCDLHGVQCPAEGAGTPQQHHAKPCQHIHWWNTWLVIMKEFKLKHLMCDQNE